MPMLDVSAVLLDPMFCELLTVQRRAETVGANGRSTLATITISPAPVGVVIPQNDLPLQRGPDQQTLPRLLQVHTPFRLRSASPGYQPDLIIWNGDAFVVNRIQDFSRYGGGFIQADCSALTAIQQPPA